MKRSPIIMLCALLTAATMAATPASAQNRQLEQIADRYADREGFSTTVIKGEISTGLSGSLNVEGVDISNIVKDISSIIIVAADAPDAAFEREVDAAVSEGYSTVLASSDNGERVRFLLSEGDGGGSRGGKSEFVIVIFGAKTNMMVSIVGNYTLGKVSKPKK